MGNGKVRKMIGVRERARQALATEAAELAARQKRIEAAVAEVWSSLEARVARADKRDARIAKLQATFDAGRAKAEADYEADAAKIRDRYAVVVQQLRADGKAPAEISELTGLTPAEVRAAQAVALPASDSPAKAGWTPRPAVEAEPSVASAVEPVTSGASDAA